MTTRLLVVTIPVFIMGLGLLVLRNAWMTIIIYHLFMVLCIVRHNNNPLSVLFKGNNTGLMVASSLVALISGLLLTLLWADIRIDKDMMLLLSNVGLSGRSIILFSIYYTVATPILEELFWRFRLSPNDMGIDITDIFFGMYHMVVMLNFVKPAWAILVWPVLFFTSWFWRFCRLKFNGLIIPLISHLFADFSIIIATLFLLKSA